MNAVDELNFLLGIGPRRPQLPAALIKKGYTAVRTLGKGSYGQALLAFHRGKAAYFVVKHISLVKLNTQQRRDAHNEVSVLQQLQHPNIIRYIDCCEDNDNLYIVMEYADGGDLSNFLDRISRARLTQQHGPMRQPRASTSHGPLTEVQVISLFVQTAMAVQYMHDRRLLHRDIKSQNIFLTSKHVVKLGDFGITTVLQNTMAMASTMCGTPCYFSPELCRGVPYNNKSDAWALGVLLYELCAGHLPFESTTMKTLMHDIVHKQPPRPPASTSDELWYLIQRLLEKDPQRRPDVTQVLRAPVLMQRMPQIYAELEAAGLSANELLPSNAPPAASSSAAAVAAVDAAASKQPPPQPPPRPQRGAALEARRVAALLTRFDEEKAKRVRQAPPAAEQRRSERLAPAVPPPQEHPPTRVRAPPPLPAALQQSRPSPGAAAAAAAAAEAQQARGEHSRPPPGELGRVLEELSTYYAHFTHAGVGDVILLPAPPPPAELHDGSAGGSVAAAEPAPGFEDVRGTALDVAELQAAHAPRSVDGRYIATFCTYDGAQQGATGREPAAATATSDADATWRGGCLCQRVQLGHNISAICGSLVCSCTACCRTSGSVAGVEWLHLPRVADMASIVRREDADDGGVAAAAAVGAGAAAATALKSGPRGRASATNDGLPSAQHGGLRFFTCVVPADVTSATVEVTSPTTAEAMAAQSAEAASAAYVMRRTSYSCPTCGSLLGMLHDELDGILFAKAALDEESAERLARFAVTERSADGSCADL